MNTGSTMQSAREEGITSEMLLLSDGRVLVHNLTPDMAKLLAQLNPNDAQLAPRALTSTEHAPGENVA